MEKIPNKYRLIVSFKSTGLEMSYSFCLFLTKLSLLMGDPGSDFNFNDECKCFLA